MDFYPFMFLFCPIISTLSNISQKQSGLPATWGFHDIKSIMSHEKLGSSVESVLKIKENGQTFQQKLNLKRKMTGNIMQVEVPDHGKFVGMSVMIAADTSENWHTKNNMVFKMEEFSMIMDLPIEFNPEEITRGTQDFVNTNQILDKKDENIFYTILVDQGSLSEQEIRDLNPDLKALVESTSVSRVAPQNITKEQFQKIQEGGRIITKSNGSKRVKRSGTDSGTCASATSMVFDHPTSHCWQWINPVTGTQIGVHQIIVTTQPNTPDPASISCCHDPNIAVPGQLTPEMADCCDRYHPSLCLCTADIFDSSIQMSPAEFASECWNCARVKTRKSVASMTSSEILEIEDALNHVTSTSLYVDIANYHGAPWMCNAAQNGPATGLCDFCPCCKPHKLNDVILFLPWHRLFTSQMEWAMQEHESSFTVPYWDWTESSTIPSFWLSGPIKPPLTSECSSTGTTQRSVGSIDSIALGNLVRTAFGKRNLLDFSAQIESPHNIIHTTIGCDMRTFKTAAYDPIFYLHHTYVDYQFAYWQELQAIYGYPEFDPSNTEDMGLNLEPFNRNTNPNTRSLRNCQGKNTFDYKNTFCYEYDELLFRGQTPTQFTTSTTPGRRKRSPVNRIQNISGLTPLQFVMDEMERDAKPRVFIGVSMRATGITSEQTATICRKKQCVEAVKLSTFGTYTKPMYEDQISSPYLVEYELTELFQSLGWPTFHPDIRSYISRYTDQGGNELPLEKTFLPVFVWRFPDQKESKGSKVLQVHFTSNKTYADQIFTDPPYQVDIYGDGDFIECISVHYQHQTYRYTGPVNKADTMVLLNLAQKLLVDEAKHIIFSPWSVKFQSISFGHNEYYQCRKDKALSKLPGHVTVLQHSHYGWTLDGKFIFSGQIDHTQGKLLLVVWCSGFSNMNEFETKEDFARCQVKDAVPREGPISYAVNTTAPGMLYLGSGVDKQCRNGRKIAINIKQEKIGHLKPIIGAEHPEGLPPVEGLPEGVQSGDW